MSPIDTSLYRNLSASEVSELRSLGNWAEDWNRVFVKSDFSPAYVRQCSFWGSSYLGSNSADALSADALALPVGLSQSVLANCVIGNDVALHNVRWLSNYAIGDRSIIFNVGEMSASNEMQAIATMNEGGNRHIRPFASMRLSDAFLWARFRDRSRLLARLDAFTNDALSSGCGCVGSHAVIKNCLAVHNVIFNSDAQAPSVASGCVALRNGVVGFGSRIDDGSMLSNFLLGENVHIDFGARVNDSVIGDNSTVARCEVGNSFVFPAHEQHHNNSFLIASLVMGQSNVAAGATIGSNHNGRSADNELSAGRGFWPGLCVSLKFPSRFASYCLLAKGDFPNELDVPLPFALISNNVSKNQLEIMPAYWWLYNMYALNRNEQKFARRDRRAHRLQHIVFDPLAPDTVEEIVCARHLLRHWTEQAYIASLNGSPLEVVAPSIERGRRKVLILKASEAYHAYEDMLFFYAVRSLLPLSSDASSAPVPPDSLAAPARETRWVNLGGQLLRGQDLDSLIADIESRQLDSWAAVHHRLDLLWQQYPLHRQRHAYQLLCHLLAVNTISSGTWSLALDRYRAISSFVSNQIHVSRDKDNANPFRRMSYLNDDEMEAVLNG